jgi:hypothetical protein
MDGDAKPARRGDPHHRREEREEATLERLDALYKQRDVVTDERTVAIKPKKNTLDIAAGKAKAPKQTRAERELKERVEAELRRAAGIESHEAPKKSRGPKR